MKRRRLQSELSDHQFKIIEKLQTYLKKESQTDVIRHAISVLDTIVQHEERGYVFMFRDDKTGHEYRVILI